MKKICLGLIICLCTITTGCFKKDTLEDISIYTTTYPIEYITNYLYGENSTISSIYPDSTDISKYSLTSKQIEDFSKTNMYIFNGLSSEKSYLEPMLKYNKELMIIDATQSMEYTYSNEELWMDPSNFLMIALNIKNGLNEYITNHYLEEEIESKYDELKIQISNVDAALNLITESSDDPTIVVDNNVLKFLEKYGFTVISLDEATVTNKNITDATNLINSGKISYIFTLDDTNLNDTVKALQTSTTVKTSKLYSLSNITAEQRDNKDDYITIMNENIDLLKNEIYN